MKIFLSMHKGPKTIEEDIFRFDQFRIMVRNGLRRVLGTVREIHILRAPDKRLESNVANGE